MKKLRCALTARTGYNAVLFLLCLLNLSDYLISLTLLSTGLLTESGPWPRTTSDGIGGFALQCLLPLLLVQLVRVCCGLKKPQHTVLVGLLLALVVGCYTLLNLTHIYWLSYAYFIFQ